MKYLIKNGMVIDPSAKLNEVCDISISDGKIEKIGKDLDMKADEVINAKGKIVAPGLVDMHTHLREPGREDEETIQAGTRAAIRGGFTAVACMPNTEPVIDSPKTIKIVKDIIKKDALCNVLIIGAITEGRNGKKLTDLAKMAKEGIVAISDDGSCIQNKSLMLEALKNSKKCGMLLIDHCEDTTISTSGVVNSGFVSTKTGLRGISAAAEYEMVKRDIGLAKKAAAPIHIAHVSCKESVEAIRKAKKDGVKITAETAPHYFTLTEDCVVTYDTNTKMNPPLRTKEDVEAIKKGLSDGTIDVIATDHAPHTDSEKDVEFDFAPFGIIGLETALSLAATELVGNKILSWPELITKMSANPAKILGVSGGDLKKGAPADVIIIDPEQEYIYKKSQIESKSKNSPFIDWKLKAMITHVFVGGNIIMKDEAMKL